MRAVFGDSGNTQIHGLLGGVLRGAWDEHRDEGTTCSLPLGKGCVGHPARQSLDGDRVHDQDGFRMLNELACG